LQSNLCSTSDDHIQKFDTETIDLCKVMMARPDEMTGDEARKRKYKDGLVLVLDDETSTSEYEYVTLFGLFY
jgi:hypothetical protein